jgi:general secretion pathway protein B
MTDHAPCNESRNRLWIGFTILVVCAAVVIGWRFVQKRESIVTVTKPVVEDRKISAGAEAGLAEASPANSSEPRATPRTDAASEKSPSATVAPRDTSAITPWDTSRDQGVLISPPASLPDDEEVVDEEVLPDHPLINIPGNWPQPIRASAAPEVDKIEPAALQEAISQMTLSLHMYNDNKAERMVYINGKKYGEGDYINGIYLLESITADGAIISHQGGRALLKPRPK